MRDSLRRLPPAYVRGNYPDNQSEEESLPLPTRRTEEDQERNLPFHRNEGEEEIEEDLPPYSKADPLGAEAAGRSNNPPSSSAHHHQRAFRSSSTSHLPRGEPSQNLEASGPPDHSNYERDVINHLWREAQLTTSEEEDQSRTSFERRRDRTVAPPHRLPSPSRNEDSGRDGDASNVESGRPPFRQRRKRQICCECSKVCWAFWMFWVLVIVIPAVTAAVQTFR